MEKYRILSAVGSGAYSQVYKAIQLSSGKMIAIKQMQLSKTNMAINKVMMRQVRILNEIGQHPNIVKVIQCFKHKDSLCLVLEYLPMDLITFYKAVRQKQRRGLSDGQITYIFKQIVSGIAFMHSKNLIHRDIKPENILIDPTSLKIKIIDFGFAKFLKNQDNTQYMVTRWYRPLEIVLSLPYDLKVDVFSLGAMLLEIYLQKQVFRSASNIDQLYWIINICGYPHWSQALIKMRELGVNVPHNQPNLSKLLKGIRSQAQDLITKMLVAVPHKRISIFQVLDHPYFCSSARKTDTPSSISSQTLQITPIIVQTRHKDSSSENQILTQQSYQQSQSRLFKDDNSLNPQEYNKQSLNLNQNHQISRENIVQRQKDDHQHRGFHQSNQGRKKMGLGKRTQSFSQGLTITAARLKNKNHLNLNESQKQGQKQKQKQRQRQKQKQKTKLKDLNLINQLSNQQTTTKKTYNSITNNNSFSYKNYMSSRNTQSTQTSQVNLSNNANNTSHYQPGVLHSNSLKQIGLSTKYKGYLANAPIRNSSSSSSNSNDKTLLNNLNHNSNSSSSIGLRSRGRSDYQRNQKISLNNSNGINQQQNQVLTSSYSGQKNLINNQYQNSNQNNSSNSSNYASSSYFVSQKETNNNNKGTMFAKVKKLCHGGNNNLNLNLSINNNSSNLSSNNNLLQLNFSQNSHRQQNSFSGISSQSSLSGLKAGYNHSNSNSNLILNSQRYSYGKSNQYKY